MKVAQFGWKVILQTGTYLRVSTGKMLREAGLHLDRKGSQLTNDIACLEPINRHRNNLNLENCSLAISS